MGWVDTERTQEDAGFLTRADRARGRYSTHWFHRTQPSGCRSMVGTGPEMAIDHCTPGSVRS